MIDRNELLKMMNKHLESNSVPKSFRIIEDTSDFFKVDYDDVVILGDRPYLIRHSAREGRFGIDDEDKYWVKRAVDLIDGKLKIIKLVFHEDFKGHLGSLEADFRRSPRKESRVLRKTRGHPNFMQGFDVQDRANNIIRILDFIKGKKWHEYILELGTNHEDYYYNHFPTVLGEYIELTEAIGFLHNRGEIHGDIRRDHIIKEKETGINKWIDFDFSYILHGESHFVYDMLGLGNVLAFITGRGDVTVQTLHSHNPSLDPGSIQLTDRNTVFKNRIVNLKKIYPYISKKLNDILLHFSIETKVIYESTTQFIDDLKKIEAS